MPENIQICLMVCITVIAIFGIISAVLFFSKDNISFNIKSRTKFSDRSETEFDIEMHKEEKIK